VLEGKVAIITGAGRGIGRATALEMARLGARVLVNDYGVTRQGVAPDAGPAEAVAAEIRAAGGEAVADAGSVANWEGARGIIAHALDAFGRLDILVNNAGIYNPAPFPELEAEAVERMLAVHLKGTFACTQAAAPHLIRQGSGRVINLSSRAGLWGRPGHADYGAAKAAIMGFTFVVARELHEHGITVNAVAPAAETRMWDIPPPVRDLMAKWPYAGESISERSTPEDVAAVIAFLASGEAAGISGQIVSITGEILGVWSPPSVDHTVVLPGGWRPETVREHLPALIRRAGVGL
jgi:NAD(P)-dependent dehydrogenase (short-subunit alcohol dehydrogenase family)